MKHQTFDCLGSGKVTASQHEMHVLGFVRCAHCGKTFKIRPTKSGEVIIRPHKVKLNQPFCWERE